MGPIHNITSNTNIPAITPANCVLPPELCCKTVLDNDIPSGIHEKFDAKQLLNP